MIFSLYIATTLYMFTDQYTLSKMQKYCVYQERCHKEVRSKLLTLKVYGDRLEVIMSKLVEDDFLNEERFAIAYTREKYRLTKWGKMKILNAMRAKDISSYCIKKAMNAVDQEEYLEILHRSIDKQKTIFENRNVSGYPLRSKLFQFAMRRGYEPDLINNCLADLLE